MTQFLYRFVDTSIEEDIINANNKVTRFKVVNSIAENETAAKVKANLDECYVLYKAEPLGTDWNV